MHTMLFFTLVIMVAYSLSNITDENLQYSIKDSSQIINVDDVKWDITIPFNGSVALTIDSHVMLSLDVGSACYISYKKAPFRVHCSLKLRVGIHDFKDITLDVEAGVQLDAETLADAVNNPKIEFYFGFTSPALSYDGIDIVDAHKFPSKGNFYVKEIDLPGFEHTICVTEFGKYIKEEIVSTVIEAAEVTGSDVCVHIKLTDLSKSAVNVGLSLNVIALDDTRIDWNHLPTLVSAAYDLLIPPIIPTAASHSDQDKFKYVRQELTGLDSKFEKDFNIGLKLLDLAQKSFELFKHLDKDTKEFKKWFKANNDAKLIVDQSTGSFQLGPQSHTLEIIIVVAACVLLIIISVLLYCYRRKIKKICCCKNDEKEPSYGSLNSNNVKSKIQHYEKLGGNAGGTRKEYCREVC